VGLSDEYPEATAARRVVLAAQHRRWIAGLIYFLGYSEAVPAAVRWEMRQYGLCADEFRRTAGWSPQLYVREARRMLGAYVVQQADCEGVRRVPDSVALGSYAMDSHIVRRMVENGVAKNEGGFFVPLREPYRISYRALVPRVEECTNLLVTFALSASHVAFGSLRMEPVFMMLSQSAAHAAALVVERGGSVQAVDYASLASRLAARGQILKWPIPPVGALVVDNADPRAEATGAWTLSAQMPGFYDDNYAVGRAAEDAQFRFTPGLGQAGKYDVFLRWTEAPNRARAVPVDVIASDGTHTVFVDQTRGGARWVRLGRWNFAAGAAAALIIRTAGTEGYVVADATAWMPAGAAPPARDRWWHR